MRKNVFLLTLLITMIWSGNMAAQDFYELSFKTITGENYDFARLKGKKVLIVNTASKCGFTPQFKELEALNKEYAPGLVILGFPSNDFMNQDPGTNQEIKEFCEINYGVTFQMMDKSSVKGKNINPVFKWLSDKSRNGWNDKAPGWNFAKYLIDEQGRLIGVWPSKTKPSDPEITGKL